MDEAFKKAVVQVVLGIPYGQTMSYGGVALEAGYPGYARHVGNLLAGLSEDDAFEVPWHRVINRSRGISTYRRGIGDLQRKLLVAEGVTFKGEKIAKEHFLG
ncbi:MGMT family protein [Deinococcus cellulosilyticus]|nr:methylated-DNA--[protein]-cysteine S-methyltransferase [Deinococcus cellulosilyticus]